MDMLIDKHFIKAKRESRAWSQGQLADVSSLSIRTIQRIESTGNASYESVLAIAAALEVPIESLKVSEPQNTSKKRQPYSRLFAGFSSGVAITLLSLFFYSAAQADQILMDVGYSVDGQPSDTFSLASEINQEVEFEIDSEFRIIVSPEVLKSGNVQLTFQIFHLSNQEYQLISQPKIITPNQEMATIVVNGEARNELSLSVTPHYGLL